MRAVLAVTLLAGIAPQLNAQQSAFVIRFGRDTTAVERFTITPTRIEGEGLLRQPRTTVRRFTMTMNGDRPATADVAQFAPGVPATGTPIQRNIATVGRDSIATETRRDTSVTRRTVPAPAGPIVPALGGVQGSFLAYEIIAQKLHAQRGTDSMTFNTTLSPTPWRAGRISRDSIWIYDGNNRLHAHVDGNGHILHAFGISGTQQVNVERIASADVNALATAFAARDAQSQGLGPLSTRDTTRATVEGATLWIDYGRPAKRGRTLFGTTLVPWGEVWRTGANAATQIRTDRNLDFGGVVVPAGFYTLWTVPAPAGWRLLINSQTGQWGTAHDATKDLFSLPMTTSRLPSVVERFTISVAPAPGGGVLNLDWDTTRASIPFTVR